MCCCPLGALLALAPLRGSAQKGLGVPDPVIWPSEPESQSLDQIPSLLVLIWPLFSCM